MSVNKAIVVGRLGRDPELKYTGSGTAVANFSIATEESWKDRNGERQKRTEWHRIVAWDKLAELAQTHLQKGSLVFIEGRMQSREWQDKQGDKRVTFEVVATEMRFLSPSANGNAKAESNAATQPETGPEIGDEDIPF
jgi:single-strand DNA-binding protein